MMYRRRTGERDGRQRQLGTSATASASMGVVHPARKHERVEVF
jgi:hypothetical protein